MLETMISHEEMRQGKKGIAQGLKAILSAEKSRRQHATLRRHKKLKNPKTKGLEIPEKCTTIDEMWWLLKEKRTEESKIRWKTISGEESRANFILRWCIRPFGQASSTRLATASWRNMLDPREAENIMEKIIEGRFRLPNGCPDEVIQFFKLRRNRREYAQHRLGYPLPTTPSSAEDKMKGRSLLHLGYTMGIQRPWCLKRDY